MQRKYLIHYATIFSGPEIQEFLEAIFAAFDIILIAHVLITKLMMQLLSQSLFHRRID